MIIYFFNLYSTLICVLEKIHNLPAEAVVILNSNVNCLWTCLFCLLWSNKRVDPSVDTAIYNASFESTYNIIKIYTSLLKGIKSSSYLSILDRIVPPLISAVLCNAKLTRVNCNNVALLFHIRIFIGGGLYFRRISAVSQKYFDALSCFSRDIHATLSINCKYISFNPNVPCLNVILTNSTQNFNSVNLHCHVYYREILGFANHPNESICKTHYSNR